MHGRQKAFSLVELSIVLVIVGLLTGGILAGQSLIKASALRSVGTDYQKYVQAITLFQNEFAALPGDMTNAQDYWGVANATPATCVTTNSGSNATCNGNGDGYVALSTGSNEPFRVWQHLASAGLIVGSYSGVTDGTTTNSATATNSPSGKLARSLWYFQHWGPITGGNLFDGDYTNAMKFAGLTTNADPSELLLKPEEAYNLDRKLDDEKPGTGMIRTNWSGCSTASASSQTTASYALNSTAVACRLLFPNVASSVN